MNRLSFSVISLVFAILMGCSINNQPIIIELSGEWKFRKAGDNEWLKANVPGCVHTDLLDNKLIPDPFYRKNELEVKWVENADWEYLKTFTISGAVSGQPNIELQLDGLDTYADVYLNDSLVFKGDNMFVGYTIPVKNALKKGENNLRIYFHSAVKIGMEKLRKVPYTLMAANEIAPENERSNVFTRKAPFHYGWDWGPRLVTCGIWRPIRLVAWNNTKMNDLYVKPLAISKETAAYKAIVEVVADKPVSACFEVWVEKKRAAIIDTNLQAGNNSVSINFAIQNPELWWTNGLGNHKLYPVEIYMITGLNEKQSLTKRIGVRTLELVQQKDSIGTSFFFKLNGVPVFMKGANYIPSDIFLTRNTIANYKRVMADAINANMNMLRVWGGAVYESDEFYDLMDENGILAWNDFMFACNIMPNDSLHIVNIKKEADYNVKRLRNHPSIALWCGNNENLRAWYDWSWNKRYTPEVSAQLWGVYEKIFYGILDSAVKQYHPEVSYWPSSPQSVGNKLSDRTSGDEHDWSVWFANVPFSTYAEKVPRFVSEYGLQAFPEMKTMRAFASDSDMAYRSPVMEHRQRSNMPWIAPGFNGNEMIKEYISKYYKVPEKFESFIYVSQLTQAEGVRYAIETHRRNMPNCMGSLYWQINDCWPTMSWASVDYFGRWKALHYFVKDAFKPILPVIFRDKNNIKIAVANDNLKPVEATAEIKLLNFDGKELWQKSKKISLVSNTSQIYFQIPEEELLSKGNAANMVFEVELKSATTVIATNNFYFKDCKYLQLDKPVIKKRIAKISDKEFEIVLSTNKLVKNLALFTSKTEGFFSNNFFDMIPGREYKIRFTGNTDKLANELILLKVNDL